MDGLELSLGLTFFFSGPTHIALAFDIAINRHEFERPDLGRHDICMRDREEFQQALSVLGGNRVTPHVHEYLQSNTSLRQNQFLTQKQLTHGKRPGRDAFDANGFAQAFMADEKIAHLWPVDLEWLDRNFEDPEFWGLPPGAVNEL